MAEYAGLEIRIGGNTTKLTNALKASTKAAADLQRQIRQATRAMQFDPHNLGNVETRIKLTGDRMQSLQSKAQLARTAMRQLGDSFTHLRNADGTIKTVRQVVEETQNLTLVAKQADERFNYMTGTLAKVYEAWNKLSRSEGSDFLVKSLNIDRKTADELMSASTSLTTLRTELMELQRTRKEAASDPMSLGDVVQITDEQLEKVARLKQLNFHDMFKRGLGLDDVIAEAKDLGVVIEDSAIANVRELQGAFKKAAKEKETFDKALQFEQLGTDLQRIDSEAESLSQTMRKLDDSLHPAAMIEGFQTAEARIRAIDAALDNVDKDLERTREAMKVDPGNIELAARYFSDLQQKADLSSEKVELLNKQMELLDHKGASEAVKGHKDLAKWVEDSAEAARVAQKEFSNQSATVANLKDQIRKLEQALSTSKGDSTLASYSDGVLKWKKATDELAGALDRLKSKNTSLESQKLNVDDAQRAFDEAKASADKYEAQLAELGGELERVNTAIEEAFSSGVGDVMELVEEGNRLEAEIADVTSAYNKAAGDVARLEQPLREHQKLYGQMAQDVQDCATEVDQLQDKVKELEQTSDVRLFQNPGEEIEKTEAELVDLRVELSKAISKENELETAYDSAKTENELAKTAQAARNVSQDADEARASLNKVMSEIDGKGGGIFNASTIKSLGMTLSATVTPVLAGIGYKMVDASADVDAAYRDMRKTVEGTEEQFEHLRAAAVEFSRTHVTSADQILQIEAIGGELGVATDALETFSEVISNIEVSTNLGADEAADALGHLGNILHLTEEDYVGFSDALVRLGNNGASTETEIVNIAERIGSMGAIVGMSGSDILALSSTIASTGQNAEAAGTAISRTMSYMETAVAAAGGTLDTSFEAIDAAVQEGGDKLTVFANLAGMTADEFAESWETSAQEMADGLNEQLAGAKDGLQTIADVAHMTSDEFIKAWESDPTSVLKAFIEGLNDLEEAGGSADSVLQGLGIKAVRQKQAIEGLMQTVGGLDDNLKMSENAWNGVSDKWGKAGDAANEAAKKAEGFSGQIQILKNMAQAFLSELGEGAVPIIKSFTSQLEWASRAFSSLDSSTKTLIVSLGGIAALAGPFLSFGSTLTSLGGEFKDFVKANTSGMSLVRMSYKHYGEVTSAALNGTMSMMEKTKLLALDLGSSILKGLAAGAVLAAIAVITTALVKLYQQYQDHIAATKGLSDALASIGTAAEFTAGSVEDTSRTFDEVWKSAGEGESRLADLAKTIEDSNRQYGNLAGQMDYYAGAIEKLGGKADRSEDETYRLSAALQAVNDACNTTYGLDEYGNIIDTQTGKIQENTDVIKANIDARKQQAIIDYYSDDYAKAIAVQEEARQNVYDLAAEYRNLRTEAGKQEWIDDYIEKTGRADLAEEAFRDILDHTKRTLDSSKAEFTTARDAVGALDEKIANASEGLAKANQVIEDAAKAQEELDRRTQTVADDVSGNMKRLSDSMDELGGTDSGFNTIAENLSAIGASAKELDEVNMGNLVAAYSSMNGSMEEVIGTLEAGGVQMTTWNAALEQAPGAAEQMGSLTASAFQTMYESANQNLDDTMTLIAGLDTVKVDDKTFYIGDNGSITDEQGKIYDINDDIAAIPEEVITTYYVNDTEAQKKALSAKKNLKDVGKQNPKAKIDATDNASPKADEVSKKLDTLNATKANPTVGVVDYASSIISSIGRGLTDLNGRVSTVTIKTVRKEEEQATGGLNNRPVIPRHATGYIAKGPTLTNQGWIGEDGVEAVANWATGGAVVPLTNKKYMLPIADAIAEGMAARGQADGRGKTVVYVTVSGVVGPNEVADAVARKLELLDL